MVRGAILGDCKLQTSCEEIRAMASKRKRTEHVEIGSAAIVDLIRSSERIALLSGAGVSTAAGIPDFRSTNGFYPFVQQHADKFTAEKCIHGSRKGPAMHMISSQPCTFAASSAEKDRLRKKPGDVVDVAFFGSNQLPLLEARRQLILAAPTWKPTAFHRLAAQLETLGKLHKVYTGNVDGIDFQLLDASKVALIHGRYE